MERLKENVTESTDAAHWEGAFLNESLYEVYETFADMLENYLNYKMEWAV